MSVGLVASMASGFLFTAWANAAPVAVAFTQEETLESGFTLDFGFPGAISTANVTDTEFELEIDPATGTARFVTYSQSVAPLILPGGINTGDISVEIIASLGGTYDRQTGVFTTNDVYAIHFTGDLSVFGLSSPFILPSVSSATVKFTGISEGNTLLEWAGAGELPNPQDPQQPSGFTYTCTVQGRFNSDNETVFMASTNPPHGAVDARQPHPVHDAAQTQGWQTVDVRFNHAPNPALTIGDFVVSEWGSNGAPPTITEVNLIADDTVRLNLSEPIAPGAWTTLTHTGSATSLCLSYLPGDVNGDGTTSPADVLATIDCLNGVAGHPCNLWNTDVDRSGQATPADILRVVDLLNGAGAFDVWNGATLGASPCPH